MENDSQGPEDRVLKLLRADKAWRNAIPEGVDLTVPPTYKINLHYGDDPEKIKIPQDEDLKRVLERVQFTVGKVAPGTKLNEFGQRILSDGEWAGLEARLPEAFLAMTRNERCMSMHVGDRISVVPGREETVETLILEMYIEWLQNSCGEALIPQALLRIHAPYVRDDDSSSDRNAHVDAKTEMANYLNNQSDLSVINRYHLPPEVVDALFIHRNYELDPIPHANDTELDSIQCGELVIFAEDNVYNCKIGRFTGIDEEGNYRFLNPRGLFYERLEKERMILNSEQLCLDRRGFLHVRKTENRVMECVSGSLHPLPRFYYRVRRISR